PPPGGVVPFQLGGDRLRHRGEVAGHPEIDRPVAAQRGRIEVHLDHGGVRRDQPAVPGSPHVQRAAPGDDQVRAADELGGERGGETAGDVQVPRVAGEEAPRGGGDREQGPAPVRERGQRGPGRVGAAGGAAAGDEDRPAGCAQPLRQGVYLVGGRDRDRPQRGGHRGGYLAARRLARLHVQRQAEYHRGARGGRAVRLGHVLVHL